MNIAVDIRCLTDRRLTGIGWYTYHLVNAMAAEAPFDRFTLFASGTNETLDRRPRISAANIRVIEQPIPNKLLTLAMKVPRGLTLERLLPEQPDIWLFPHPHIMRTNVPYVVTVHDLTLDLLPDFFTFADHLRERFVQSRDMVHRAKRVLAVSHNTANDLASEWNVPRERITVTHLGVDPQSLGAREQSSDRSFRAAYDLNRPYILALATIEPRKNFESIVEAYDTFRTQGGAALPLVLVGGQGWKSRRFNDIIAGTVFRHDIRILGYVPEKHKPALYRGATAFLFPSFYEGFGLPVAEALSCGAPVITSFAGSLPEIAGNAALYVDPFNVTDLTQALHHLFDPATGTALRKNLRERGIEQAKTFSWAETARQTLATLRSAVTR
ncbi:MAG: glycosyltransferase family 4 protein [Candidatus Uhrbacteria bacterium]|nr:glycosyltransferase family 4 protein [Candidatus Uhrbacteria bacterium]